MDKEKAILFLEKYNYDFSENNKGIIVKLDFSLHIEINFDNNKVFIKDKLVSWNFLTGLVEMSLKNAYISIFAGLILVTVMTLISNQINGVFYFTPFFFLYITWILIFSCFYLVKSEGFKTKLINYLK